MCEEGGGGSRSMAEYRLLHRGYLGVRESWSADVSVCCSDGVAEPYELQSPILAGGTL